MNHTRFSRSLSLLPRYVVVSRSHASPFLGFVVSPVSWFIPFG